MQNIILETDASMLASALTSTGVDRSSMSCLVCQIRDFLLSEFSSYNVSLCNRICNKVADALAAFGMGVLKSGSDMLTSQVSGFVSELVSGDLPTNEV